MKITGVQVYEYDAAWAHGDYGMSHGRVARSQRSLVVRITTDEELDGWSETCPNGRTYLPSFVEGERAALAVLAEAVRGLDPTNLSVVHRAMDEALLGSRAAKAAVDMACWDLFGTRLGLPVAELLGGTVQEEFPLFVAVPIDTLDAMAGHVERDLAAGVRVFQVKVGDEPMPDVARVRAVLEAAGPECTVIADANGGWHLGDALTAAGQLAGLPIRLEQPCRDLADCAELRRHTALPLILDELVVTLADLVLAKQAGATGINLKPSRVGGLAPARAMRDAAQGLGMTFTVDDTWGGALTTAQNAALAASCSPEHLTGVTYFAEWIEPLVATGPRMLVPGRGTAPTAPGLGLEVDVDQLGVPVLEL